MVVSLDKKTRLVTIGVLIVGVLSLSCKSIRPTKDNLIGKWVMTSHPQDSYKLHDTIEFRNNKVFISTIVPSTTNSGKWNYRQGKIKLKSCLHSADNLYKCRDFKWEWQIIEINENRMIILQNDKELRIEYKIIE